MIKQFIKMIFKSLGLGVTSHSHLAHLEKRLSEVTIENRELRNQEFLIAMGSENTHQISTLLQRSKSQLRQDLFVLTQHGFKNKDFLLNLVLQME